MKHKAPKQFSLYGRAYEGATVAEAKANAHTAVDLELHRMDLGPFVAMVQGASGRAVVMAYSMRSGMASVVLESPNRPFRRGWARAHTCTFGGDNMMPATRSAVLHAAQLAWSDLEPDDSTFVQNAVDQLAADSDRNTVADKLKRWIRFQRGYAANIAAGMLPSDAHDKAGRESWA